ncbi:hypothetical protein [Clostridium sp. Marseille-P299]|uniref:hypothetical protein n=1 Tax=Clostridium sp. Marseille-P299 TaxID=1805477 RepID=UPI000A72C05F|nr:hypothetical protein [Clostridium sp. Marseille-P299]
MTNEEFKQMMINLLTSEENRLGVGSQEFINRHNEIINACESAQASKKSQVRMRTVKATVEYFKQEDPETPVNEYMLRRLIKQKKISVVHAGNKVLINLDKFIDYLNNDVREEQVETVQAYGKLRKVME